MRDLHPHSVSCQTAPRILKIAVSLEFGVWIVEFLAPSNPVKVSPAQSNQKAEGGAFGPSQNPISTFQICNFAESL